MCVREFVGDVYVVGQRLSHVRGEIRTAVCDGREGDQVGCRVLELRVLAAGLDREIEGMTSLSEIRPVTRQLDEVGRLRSPARLLR